MAKTISKDDFVNRVVMYVPEGTLNTGIVKVFPTTIGVGSNIGLKIHRIEYYVSNYFSTMFAADDDILTMGVALANISVDSLGTPNDNRIMDWKQIRRVDLGTAGTGVIGETNFFRTNFTDLPSGGKLASPQAIYAFVIGSSLTEAANVWFTIDYTQVTMDQNLWREFAEYRLSSGSL